MSTEDVSAQERASLQDLYVVMVQIVEVLEPYATRYPAVDKHLADARAICNDLKIKLEASTLRDDSPEMEGSSANGSVEV